MSNIPVIIFLLGTLGTFISMLYGPRDDPIDWLVAWVRTGVVFFITLGLTFGSAWLVGMR